MGALIVEGGRRLEGCLTIDSAKNSVLPIMAAALMADDPVTIREVPDITDAGHMANILERLGCRVTRSGRTMIIDPTCASQWEMPDSLSKQIRSSIFLMGPILARFGRAMVTYPGGCEIGLRPIDLHLSGLKCLGVQICEEGGLIHCDGSAMHAGEVHFDYPSVGATENVMMAAAMLDGTSCIHNAAREPEIVDLQNFINAMGGQVEGAGGQTIYVHGVKRLRGAVWTPIPDRIVAGTMLAAAAITGGEAELRNVIPGHLVAVTAKLREMGCRITEERDRLCLWAPPRLSAFATLQTQPHPGFPTDMQVQMLTLLAVSEGTGVVVENVFENRFTHAGDLNRMGAQIMCTGRSAVVRGVKQLYGAEVTARDLRGGAALVLAGLQAQGTTRVANAALIDRGYDHIENQLRQLGAAIERKDE